LIEDLIDASKVSTGNVQMTCEEIGLNELVRQSIGEFQEKFTNKSLDVRVQEVDSLKVMADGKAMWRVMENIFDNISKYALTGSRVYIQVLEENNQGVIVAKNISEIPLEISPEELMQRFVRGSESRTTEGSGLGLSIAEGLVNAQGGSFEIVIDGDLFKVTIEMPMASSQADS
jgi:signal transduction histidine kinase